MIYREWQVGAPSEDAVETLAREAQLGMLLSSVLVSRGVDTAQAAADIIECTHALPLPLAMKDMNKAVERIRLAVQNEESIAVFGDYDVDGITATAMVYTYLEDMGAQVFYKLPSRSDDSYGLSPKLVDTMADRGISLIVTVDNGTTAFEAAERAKERGVSLVVTDHHLPYESLPDVHALVNPCRVDDESELTHLSGAGVAFMLLAALEECPAEELMPMFGDLAAVGTVADVMKLSGHNRTLVKLGMNALQETQRPGLRALIAACGWEERTLTAENISYGLAPRLNAAGRMDDATLALQLLLEEDERAAEEIVQQLQEYNTARKTAEQEMLEIIERQMDENPNIQRSRVLVIWGDGWNQGVIGIVASRLVDRYAKPAIVVSFEQGEGKGSGRSVGGFSLHGAIASCEDILIRYGGHDLAAGFSIEKEHMQDFRKRVNEWAVKVSPVSPLPRMWADVRVDIKQVNVAAVQELDKLAPCGSGNPVPRLLLKGMCVEAVYPIGDAKHSRLRMRQPSSGNSYGAENAIHAVMFGIAPQALPYRPGDLVDVILSLSVYEGARGSQVSARVVEIRPAGMKNLHAEQSAVFESFYAGWQPDEERRKMLLPTREDVAHVYRLLKGPDMVYYGDLRPVFIKLGEDKTGRTLAAVAVLEELGLIERDISSGCYKVVNVKEKRELCTSALFKRLSTV